MVKDILADKNEKKLATRKVYIKSSSIGGEGGRGRKKEKSERKLKRLKELGGLLEGWKLLSLGSACPVSPPPPSTCLSPRAPSCLGDS